METDTTASLQYHSFLPSDAAPTSRPPSNPAVGTESIDGKKSIQKQAEPQPPQSIVGSLPEPTPDASAGEHMMQRERLYTARPVMNPPAPAAVSLPSSFSLYIRGLRGSGLCARSRMANGECFFLVLASDFQLDET